MDIRAESQKSEGKKKGKKKARVRGRLFLLVCAFDVEKELPCLHETRLREVNAFHNSKVTQYNRDVNLPRVNVSRINTA